MEIEDFIIRFEGDENEIWFIKLNAVVDGKDFSLQLKDKWLINDMFYLLPERFFRFIKSGFRPNNFITPRTECWRTKEEFLLFVKENEGMQRDLLAHLTK